MEAWNRTERLLGDQAMARLGAAHVLILGLGGVGGHCADALARCGVGSFALVDPDSVAPSNLNRQMVALHSTLGMRKTDVMQARILDINPGAKVLTHPIRFPSESDVFSPFPDCIVDAIDDVPAKVALAVWAQQHSVAIVSCMGAGNKLDPTQFEAADIYATSNCPLCRAMRSRLRKADVASLRVVYSRETPCIKSSAESGPGSIAYVTAAAGLVLAREAVQMLLQNQSSTNNENF